jgi:RND superfamily putative drug exporter
VGLAAAVLIDATVVRGILTPAALTLLGERAWSLPRWLGWLPGGPREAGPAAAAPAAPPAAVYPAPSGSDS